MANVLKVVKTPRNVKITLPVLFLFSFSFFERRVRPMLRPEDDGKLVALDVQTGDYELDEDDYAAVSRLRARNPVAGAWLGRVGSRRRTV